MFMSNPFPYCSSHQAAETERPDQKMFLAAWHKAFMCLAEKATAHLHHLEMKLKEEYEKV